MLKWKIRIYIFIYFLYLKLVNINCKNQVKDRHNFNHYHNIDLVPKKVEIKYLKYSENYQFSFEDTNATDNLLVHFHSLDCNIRFINNPNTNKKKNEIKKNLFSVFIKNNEINTTKLLVRPSINLDDNDKYKDLRKCPVVINSLYINDFQIHIKEQKEYMAFNFDENLSYVELLYHLNSSNFIMLSFMFDEKYSFIVEINGKPKSILNSSNIFLDYNNLINIKNNTLKINISYIRNNMTEEVNNPFLIFSLFDFNSTSILQTNTLNIGYTISNEVKQYYYLEVFKDEEGEIILHDKRFCGKLNGIIRPKSSIKFYYNATEYLNEDSNNKLKFDSHTLKLSFKLNESKQCEEGCYLFITYTHDNFDFNPIFGSELTLLVRTWSKENIFPQIINIPFNEYIFGVFEEDSINHHFYSLSIPENTDEIIIQFEGSYIDGFIGGGKKRLNTFRKLDYIWNLNITENKKIWIYNETLLKEISINDSISFAFRPKNFFNQVYSFYYIRILLKEKNKNRIYPIVPNIGNICIPEKDNEKGYFCKCRLNNNHK